MPPRACWFTAILVLVTATTPAAVSADVLESVVKKAKLDRADRAKIEAEITVRVKRFMDAAGNPRRRRNARQELIATSRIPGATSAGLDAYAEACADELNGPIHNKKLMVALDAINILVALDNQNTAAALARALSSEHVSVRYAAADGIRALHKTLAKRRSACRNILRALGRAGETERHELVLREAYRAINFKADVANFQSTDEAAQALARVFAARSEQLSKGSHDEWKDLEGYIAAADCYADANPDTQRELIRHLAHFLTIHVERYAAPDLADAYLPTLRKTVRSLEKSIHGMMRTSKVSPPGKTVSAAIRKKPGNRSKRKARAALTELNALLKREPWNLP